jgi:hypothetical protein
MIWNPFRTLPAVIETATAVAADNDRLYFARQTCETALEYSLARRDNIVLYGPARQGKTTLLGECLALRDCIYIECRPDFKRPHLYRLILSSLGYSVSIEKKKRQKAQYSVKFGLFGTNMNAGIDADSERTLQEINIDLKNPSEVAHLISRIPHIPYVILNGFHALNPETKRSVLFDFVFFAERSDIRYIIVGSWMNVDYLEIIEPAVAGKLQYVFVPYWSKDELVAAYDHWRDRNAVHAVSEEILEEMILLSGGDISLFVALVMMPKMESLDKFKTETSALVVGRSLPSLERKIQELFMRRELALSYGMITTDFELEPNPAFQSIQGAKAGDYHLITINPETGRPYPDAMQVAIDADGNPQYRETAKAELATRRAEVGSFLIKKSYSAVQEGSGALELKELATKFQHEQIPMAVAVDATKLRDVFLKIEEAQRRIPISPPLFTVDRPSGIINISDRRFYLTLKSMEQEEFDEWIERHEPDETPKPRRSARVSADIPPSELARMLADASHAVLSKLESPKGPYGAELIGHRTRRSSRAAGSGPPKSRQTRRVRDTH